MNHKRLPQTRLYLKAAEWGIDELLARRLIGYGFRFHLIGILASLRASQHALVNHDRCLSDQHRKVVGKWWKQTRSVAAPEWQFIRTSRDLILKEGRFPASAGRSETDYTLSYDRDGEHHDLVPHLQAAVAWSEKEFATLELSLPDVLLPD